MSVGSELYDWGDPNGIHGHLIIDDYAQHSVGFMTSVDEFGQTHDCFGMVGADDMLTMSNSDPSLAPDVPSSGAFQNIGDWYHEHSSILMLLTGAAFGYFMLYAASNAARAIR